ncbi:MAG TPA: CARDB domain-containing protein, partial [Methanomassiliicoccaceae archaeon]|nr:CARDB domain-containing protein [Methanomassiliicoccaceae archaeon]HQA21778.1 CARDB domain-containing protein [Methanomassiliicoccaceae archaeon]HQD88436.1 CARDB domain-containing protein [Methanomassiliicoccaceae archaeon]
TLAVLAALVMAAIAVPAPAAAQNDSYLIEVSGPEVMIPGEKAVLTVKVEGGPDGLLKYNASVPSGASVTPKSGTTSSRTFTLTVTAPATIGSTFAVNIGVSSQNGSVSANARYEIKVVEPVTLSADIVNTANVTAVGIPVQFWVDGDLVGTVNATIPAATTQKVSYNWSVASLSPGRHVLKVVIDPDQHFVTFPDGSNEFVTEFYVGDGGWGTLNILLAILVVIFLVVVFFTYMNRGKKKKKRRPRA